MIWHWIVLKGWIKAELLTKFGLPYIMSTTKEIQKHLPPDKRNPSKGGTNQSTRKDSWFYLIQYQEKPDPETEQKIRQENDQIRTISSEILLQIRSSRPKRQSEGYPENTFSSREESMTEQKRPEADITEAVSDSRSLKAQSQQRFHWNPEQRKPREFKSWQTVQSK